MPIIVVSLQTIVNSLFPFKDDKRINKIIGRKEVAMHQDKLELKVISVQDMMEQN